MSDRDSSNDLKLRLGTRRSPLAMAQAFETRERLCVAHGWREDQVELVPVLASGDKIKDRPLADIGGKALWTKELDAWLAEGRIDVAVNSLKDVETERPAELTIGAILPRADVRDVLLGASSIRAIPRGAKVGTSSPRRAAQMLNARPDLEIVGFRGNVATRMAKLAAGEADITLLAAAGLERLGETGVGTPLEVSEWPPAASQGAIGLECRSGDKATLDLLAPLDDADTRAQVLAERAFLLALGGTCHSPVAAHAAGGQDGVTLTAILFSPDGASKICGSASFAGGDNIAPAELAAKLLGEAPANITDVFKGAD
ncbi:hydroxymethylbilane synthase [Altererythrobacter sp. ZODW24]|uniref:hydroxymethylbilane synthase n=1 Tax=Altererythrobacter sp. ZODW24 TaxID=2185142 RepID=UPI000DF7B018|nr:hydroxymethylbilane synthase [Altererythrobacter sp. ZODW24]